ncbi:MAG: hypothetical protein GQ559_10300 [Desulfobulbaceae bacterium]|nr:hypothetical protein [Desulfobulbaceae bacterium]
MTSHQSGNVKVLLLYFSFSSQTKNLLSAIGEGLESQSVTVDWERIETVDALRFPIGNIPRTVWMMLLTFIRKRMPIQPISETCYSDYNLIILAGPTWSYNPSGPILSLFDRDGKKLFKGRQVLPLISCRGYWRTHWWGLKTLLKKSGATVLNMIVFSHPSSEPWRTIGVFLKLAGRVPERNSWISKYYHKYGHTRGQIEEARLFGSMIGQTMNAGRSLDELDFKTPVARP